MKILFLDIDGVVVTKRSAYAGFGSCPAAITALRRVIARPDFKLVISSARRANGLDHFSTWLRSVTQHAPQLLGALAPAWCTPDLAGTPGILHPEELRTAELHEYCRQNNIARHDCLALDDLDLTLWRHGVWTIHVDADNGLTMEQLRQLEAWAIQNS